jgi:retron-type reverse transcriptase
MPRKIRSRTSLRVATFHARSYGFRTGRATHDAQKILFNNLRSWCNGKDKRVIELDIEKCFDRINHSAIMDNLIADIAYWSKRHSILYDGYTSKALKRQNHSCNSCGLKFIGEQRVHLHHVDGNHQNWKDKNLVAIHQSGHQFLHTKHKRKLRRSGAV